MFPCQWIVFILSTADQRNFKSLFNIKLLLKKSRNIITIEHIDDQSSVLIFVMKYSV